MPKPNALKEKLGVTLSDPKTGKEHTVEVDCDGPLCSADAMMEAAPEAAREARRTFATHFVNYDAYDSDSEYADMLAKVGERFTVEGMGKPGDAFRHSVYGLYGDPREEGTWADWVHGVDRADAEFQAKWQMALNCGAEPKEDFEQFLATMSDMEITDCAPEALTRDEAIGLLRRIVDPKGDRRAALAEARKKLAEVDLSLRKDRGSSDDAAPKADVPAP